MNASTKLYKAVLSSGMPNQTTHTLYKIKDGKVRLERRNDNLTIYARARFRGADGRRHDFVMCTHQTVPSLAAEEAEHWYDEQKRLEDSGQSIGGRLFAQTAGAFIKWANEHRKGEISDGQLEQYQIKWDVLKPYFKGVKVTDAADRAFLVRLRQRRLRDEDGNLKLTQFKKPVRPATLRKDLLFVRMVLNYAVEIEKSLTHLPKFPKSEGEFKVAKNPQPYLTLREYNHLHDVAKARMYEPALNVRVLRSREDVYCFLLLSVGACLRPSEAYSIRWMDCELTRLRNEEKSEAVKMMVKGKHYRHKGEREKAFAVLHGVKGYKLLKKLRPEAKPEDLLFPIDRADGIEALLTVAGLRKAKGVEMADRPVRTAKCFRPTGISLFRLLSKNPDIADIAKMARTSVQQIQDFYDQNPFETAIDRLSVFKRPK